MIHRNNSGKKNAHVVWDEENLKENAEIQKEYSQVRIQEPKTPYHAPVAVADEEDEDMKPLDLDQEAAAMSKATVMTAFDFVMSNGGADYTEPGPSRRRAASSAASADDEATADAAGCSNKRSEPCNSFTSSGSEGPGGGGDPGSADKRRRFQAMRRQHYNMKQALEKAKQLLASEDEEDEEADTAGWHRSRERPQEQADAEAASTAGAQQAPQSSNADLPDAVAPSGQQEQQVRPQIDTVDTQDAEMAT